MTLPTPDLPAPAESSVVDDHRCTPRHHDVLDAPGENAFDRITALAARTLRAPFAVVGLTAADQPHRETRWWRWPKGVLPPGIEEMESASHGPAFIHERLGWKDDLCVTADALTEPALTDPPRVAATPPGADHLPRAYAAAALRAPDGEPLGFLAVLDPQCPRTFSDDDLAILRDLAGIVADELETRRQARALWRDRETDGARRYRELFDASPLPMWVYDPKTLAFLDANDAALRDYGYSREELAGMTLADIRPAEDVPALVADVHRPAGTPTRPLWRHRRRDGALLDVEVFARDLTTSEGRSARLATVLDVTERRRAENSLRRRDRYLAALVEVQRELLRHERLDDGITRALELLGYASGASRVYVFDIRPDLATGEPLVHEKTYWRAPGVPVPGDLNAERIPVADITPAWTVTLTRGEPVHAFRSRLRGIEHHLLDLCGARSILLAPIVVAGELRGALGFAHVEEERLWEPVETGHLLLAASTFALAIEREAGAEALAAEKERLAVTLAALDEGVITTDRADRVILMNRAAETLTGRSREAALGQPLREVLVTSASTDGSSSSRPGGAAATSVGLPEGFSLAGGTERLWLEGADGGRRLIAHTATALFDGEQRPVGAVRVFRDVSDEERLAAEMVRASKLESLGILAGGIAHDFNNILTAVLGNVSLARRLSLPPPAAEKLDEAERAGLRARDLTGQLLTFARGGAPLKKLARLPEIIRDSVGFALHGSSVRGCFVLDPDLWPVEADAGQLSQVLNNLGINAVQAIGTTGGDLEVRAENLLLTENDLPSGLPGGRYVKISVEDDGVGIPPEALPKIFDPFFTTKEGGSGLGLATSYSIAQRHGGFLNVDSVPGVGSIFRLYLPAADPAALADLPAAAPEPDPASPSPAPHSTVTTMSAGAAVCPATTTTTTRRVLVLDDEAPVQTLLADMLRHLGCEVVVTAAGTDTLAAYRKAREQGQPFDLLILDLTVPGGMGGREVLATLRGEDPGVRAIVSSGYANDPIISRYAEHGFVGVLSKPYRLDDLTTALGIPRGSGPR